MIEKIQHNGRWIIVRRALWRPEHPGRSKPNGAFQTCWNGMRWTEDSNHAQYFPTAEAAQGYLVGNRIPLGG